MPLNRIKCVRTATSVGLESTEPVFEGNKELIEKICESARWEILRRKARRDQKMLEGLLDDLEEKASR